MVDDAKSQSVDGEGTEFLAFLAGFSAYTREMTDGVISHIRGRDEQAHARVLQRVVVQIVDVLRDELTGHYRRADQETATHLNRVTTMLGGVKVVAGIRERMAALAASDHGARAAAAAGAGWKKALEIIELIKKILRAILDTKIFGVPLGNILNLGIDLDHILEVIDNIMRGIAELFGGQQLALRMYEIETENVKMHQLLLRTGRIRHGLS